MEPTEIIDKARNLLQGMEGHIFEQLTVNRPTSQFEALNMFKITSKISPLVGNLFEIDAAEALADDAELGEVGNWIRQDPDFPDVLLDWNDPTQLGFEVKAWYPLSTEITGRFKDSQNAFTNNEIHVVLFAWLPEHLLWGRPKILRIAVVPGHAIAAARDAHYHNPPDYLVIEPRDTSSRTRNLQQRNTSGYKWQSGNSDEAARIVRAWGEGGTDYQPTPDYQEQVNALRSQFSYRLDTNYGKMDRVVSAGVEDFKSSVLEMVIEGRSISNWARVLRSAGPDRMTSILSETFGIESRPANQTDDLDHPVA